MARHGENIRMRQDGRWEARAMIFNPDIGRNTYRSFYGKTYQEAKQKRMDYLRGSRVLSQAPSVTVPVMQDGSAHSPNLISGAAGSAAFAAPRTASPDTMLQDTSISGIFMAPSGLHQPTFGEATLKWLAAKRPRVKESTYVHYVTQANRHLLPELESMPLCEIHSRFLEELLTRKLESGGLLEHEPLSSRTVSDLKIILMQILKYARKTGMIDSLPDCPSVPCLQQPIQVLTGEEQEQLVRCSLREDNAFSLGILLSLYAGLRIGEVCALQWEDFDFLSGTVNVRKTVMRIYDLREDASAKTRAFVDSPKTVCSIRTIPLVNEMAGYFLKRQKPDEIFVVTGTDKFMEPRVCLDRYKRLLTRAGLPKYTFHLLRHTFATRCVEKGVDFKSLSEFMGHSDVSITMQRYVHPSMELKKEQINKLTPSLQEQVPEKRLAV